MTELRHGIRENLPQFTLQLLQVFFVGLTIGMMRTVVPVLAEKSFGIKDQFLLLVSFVVVFGLVKAVMNLWAGHLSDRLGRRGVLIVGWLVALPIPWLILYAQDWSWVVAATLLLGLNQGMCWSMALNSKLDLARPEQRGLVNGLNEFFGYAAVGMAGWITAWLADQMGAREALYWFGQVVIGGGLVVSVLWVMETRPWAMAHAGSSGSASMGLVEAFKKASLHDRELVALNQAGLVEKFVDALVWLFWPLFFVSKGLTLLQASQIIAVYAVVWGASQLITGPLSDKVGRKRLIVWGMLLCGLGAWSVVWWDTLPLWYLAAALTGVGMAMVYPTLGAAVADKSPPSVRGAMLGVYRFWRDFGYAVGALIMGGLMQFVQAYEVVFAAIGISMVISGLWVQWAYQERGDV
ncbi:MFS transporter [Sulfurivirga sp.]|uniref:MFS transporter n=1 Tax=Sulfurivirga sp. TaxID=2614236 RepID=UPI0025DF4864|nr:MFS transporter [Sulfurivirga sp.]